MPRVEVSNGELLDKWTILQIKLERLKDVHQLDNVTRELASLESEVNLVSLNEKVMTIRGSLFSINLDIWDLMEKIYLKGNSSDAEYLQLTLEITILNQKRAFAKKAIDIESRSLLSESKSFFEDSDKVL